MTKDVTRDGATMKAGDMVLVPSALHGIDPLENPDPMRVDYARKPLSHSTFGAGAQICTGMHLARMEVAVTLQEWLKRIPEFSLEPGFRMVAHSGVVARFEALNLECKIAG